MKIKLLGIAILTWPLSLLAADSVTTSGVVTNVNPATQTITVRSDETGIRRTYFIDQDTRLSSQGRTIQLGSIRKGHSVRLTYNATDTGRTLETLRVPQQDVVNSIPPVENASIQTVSGVVTGVRSSERTITIRNDADRQRRTLKVPEETVIRRDDKPINLNRIRRGDHIVARYRVTDQGLMLVGATAPVADVVDAPVEPAPELPKTAGWSFVALYAAMGFLGLAGLIRVYRRRA